MEKRDDFFIPEDVIEWINLKKSEYLSKLIQFQANGDYGFEEFHLFDQYIPGTIENPDKSFETTIDSQKVRIYLKTYKVKSFFHQVVIGAVVPDKEKNANVYVPIISFVTRFDELVKEFCVGEVISRPTLN